MCGIAGLIHLDQAPVSPAVLQRMTDAIAHRGPDGEGHWIEGHVGLGHRRLAIIDLSPAGHEPMVSADHRYVLSYNGEIYNFRAIRRDLERGEPLEAEAMPGRAATLLERDGQMDAATGYLAEVYGMRPEPFYLGIVCAAAGLALSLLFGLARPSASDMTLADAASAAGVPAVLLAEAPSTDAMLAVVVGDE